MVNSWMDLVVINKPSTRMLDKTWNNHEDEQFGRVIIANIWKDQNLEDRYKDQ